MKNITTITTILIFLTACTSNLVNNHRSGNVPTPVSTFSFEVPDKSIEWAILKKHGNAGLILTELYPEAESTTNWNQKIAIEISFIVSSPTMLSRLYADTIKEVDPDISYNPQILEDDSVVIEYESSVLNEKSIRKYIGGSDGTYMLAYYSRPTIHNTEEYGRWRQMIVESKLIPNPK